MLLLLLLLERPGPPRLLVFESRVEESAPNEEPVGSRRLDELDDDEPPRVDVM